LQNSLLHGEPRSFIDINAIDHAGVDRRDRPGDGPFADPAGENLAVVRIDFLAVVESPDRRIGRKDNGRRDDGAKQRAAANFIGAGNETVTSRSQSVFRTALALPAGAFVLRLPFGQQLVLLSTD
jgi:hypothetical protein